MKENSLICGLDDLDKVIQNLKSKITNLDCIILLQGTLASGKTTFVKQYIESLGLDDIVTSPTFSLQTIYNDNIFHYDVYNKTLEEFISLGLLEEFEKEGIHFVEWGNDKLKSILDEYGFNVITIKISKKEDKREYLIDVA